MQFINNGTNYDPAFSYYDASPANLMYTRRVSGTWPTPVVVAGNNTQGRYSNLLIQSNDKARIVFQNANGTSVETISIRDEPANWQTDSWTNTNLLTGGGSGGQAVRVSDSEFFYTRVGLNPSNPTLYVSNHPKEGKTWGLKTDAAAFGDRWSHATVSFKEGGVDTMWVIGGALAGFDTDTVYSSTDGLTWTQRTTTGMFSARRNFTANVFNDGTGDKIWAFGGNAGSTLYNDLYYSSDGVTWNAKTTANAPSARHGHSAVVSGGYLYVIGGTDSGGLLNDVWRFDGSDWSQVTPGAGSRFTARSDHVALAYNTGGGEKLWVMGGNDGHISGNPANDAWSSGDGGATWTQVTAGANWSDRAGAAATVFDNRMWITGGQTGGASNYITDAWWSVDGANWFSAIDSIQYGARRDHGALVFKHRLWIVGGAGSAGAGDTVYYAKNGEA